MTADDAQAIEKAKIKPIVPVDGIDPKILLTLSPEQLRYVMWEVTPDWFKSVPTLIGIAKELEVSVHTIYLWRRTPNVMRAFAAFGMYVVKSGIADRQVFENLV